MTYKRIPAAKLRQYRIALGVGVLCACMVVIYHWLMLSVAPVPVVLPTIVRYSTPGADMAHQL